jgi:hypothetical protein
LEVTKNQSESRQAVTGDLTHTTANFTFRNMTCNDGDNWTDNGKHQPSSDTGNQADYC